jgi:hypothetical protein
MRLLFTDRIYGRGARPRPPSRAAPRWCTWLPLNVCQRADPLASAPVIRLNAMLERGRRHRWLGPAFVVLLALLLALVVLHTAADQATESGVVCLAILMILIAILLPAPPQPLIHVRRIRAPRAPPPTRNAQSKFLSITPPLRL